MARRRKSPRTYKKIEITMKSGEKKNFQLIETSQSGKSLKVIFPDNHIGYVQLKQIKKHIVL